MRGNKAWGRVAALATLALVAAACGGNGEEGDGGSGGGGADKPLKLGYVLPETGDLAFLGPPQINAATLAVNDINRAGGVLGNEIPDLVGGDEANDQSVANQSADRVLSADVDAIIGAAASGMSLAIIDKVINANVVQCSASNTAPTFTDYEDKGYYFRTAPSDVLQGPILADTVISDGHSNVAVVARADDYGRGLANATADALEKSGATVAVNTTYDPKTTNFDAVVQKVTNKDPDAVVVVAFEEGKQILRGLIEAGLSADRVGLYGADGLRSEELPKLVDPKDSAVLKGMKGTAPASAESEEFTSRLKKEFPKLKELQFAPQAYDCVVTVALAAEAAESTDPTKFKDEMNAVTTDGEKCATFEDCQKLLADGKDIDYDGRSGPLDFGEPGEPDTAQIEVYGYNAKGQLQTLDTVTSKSAT